MARREATINETGRGRDLGRGASKEDTAQRIPAGEIQARPTIKEVIMPRNGTAQAIEKKEWQELKDQIESVIRLFGSLLFTPVILLIGIGYGLRAGIIVGTEKALSLFKEWGEL